MGGARQPFAGDHVAIAGRLSLFSKRDVRSLVERLGGVFSADVTPRTTVIISTATLIDPPPTVAPANAPPLFE